MKQQLELDMKQWTGSKLGKEYIKAIYWHPAYLTYMESTSCEVLGWMNHKTEWRLSGEISTTSYFEMTIVMVESKEELRSLLIRVKEENEKAGLKLNIQKIKIMASSSISSVQFSRSVMSDSLRPHESQHARPPSPSPTPRVHSDSRPSSQWCHPAISSSVIPFSSCPQSLPASGMAIAMFKQTKLLLLLSLHSSGGMT